MTDNIEVVVKESGSTQVEQTFNSLASAAARAQRDIAKLQKTLGNVGRSTAAANRMNGLGQSAQAAAAHVNNLNSALTSLNNTRVTTRINNVNSAMRGTGTAATSAARGVRDLLAAYISFQTVKNVVSSLVDAQIAIQQIHYGLIAATGSAKGAADQFKYLEDNANKLGLDLKTSAMEYTRLAASATAMNVAVSDQQKLYTALSQTSTVLHLSEQKVQFATLALTQMFSKGKIQAEELRRQLGEAIPGVVPRFQRGVMEVVKGTNLAKYSFEQLMKRGLLNTKQFLPQLIDALAETGRGWQDASKGLNAELNRLRSEWFKLKVDLSKGLFNDAMIAIVRFLSSNLKELTGIVSALGVAIAVTLAPVAIVKFIGYVKQLAVAVWAAAGPWGILLGVIAGLVTYFVSMRDSIKVGIDDTTTLGDLMRATWESVKESVASVWDFLGGFWSALVDNAKAAASAFTSENQAAAKNSTSAYQDFFANTGSGFSGFLMKAAKTVDAIVGLLMGVGHVIVNVFSGLPDLFGNIFNQVYNAVVTRIQAMINASIDAINKIASLVGKNLVEHVQLETKSVDKEYWKKYGQHIADGIDQGFKQEGDFLQKGLKGIYDRAKQIGAARTASQKDGGGTASPGSDIFSPKTADAKAAKSMEKLKDALSRVIGKINPTQQALKELADSQEVLNNAVNKGLISQEKADWVMGRLRDKYKEVLDPVGALIDKYKEERDVLKFTGDEQRVQAELLTKVRDLKKKNYVITDEQVKALQREIEATQAATRANQAYNDVLNQTIYARRADMEKIDAVGAAKKNGAISGGQAAQQAVGIFGNDAMANTSEQMKAQQQAWTDMYAKIDEARQKDVISEQTATALKLRADQTYREQKLSTTQSFLGTIASMQNSHSKKAAKIAQAAAIANATIDTYKAATGAYAAMASIPYVGPFLGAAAAAAAIVAGMANVSAIRSQQVGFRTGGSMVVGGSGGPDSQLVQFQATPGEQINVNTPAQARALERLAELQAQQTLPRPVFNQNITQVIAGKPDRTTPTQYARAARRETVKELGN